VLAEPKGGPHQVVAYAQPHASRDRHKVERLRGVVARMAKESKRQ